MHSKIGVIDYNFRYSINKKENKMFKNSPKKILNWLKIRKLEKLIWFKEKKLERLIREEKKRLDWIKKLYDKGLSKVEFPIVIVHNDAELDFVENLSHYALNPDLYFWEFDNSCEVIDANFKLWKWKYDKNIEANLPNKIIKDVSEDHVISLILNFLEGKKITKEIKEIMESPISIKEKIIELSNFF